jgi:hypothetical protein
MPKCEAKVIATTTDDQGRLLAKIQFNRKMPLKGEVVVVKWGSIRTLPQNSLYWVYLNWLINEAGLKEHGHFSAMALHLDLKERLKYIIEALEEETTTILTKSEFGEYLDTVDKFIQKFFEIDTSSFWERYKTEYEMLGPHR